MNKIDFSQVELHNVITHRVGNKLRDENIKLTEESTFYSEETKEFILRYFLLPVKSEEFYEFTHSVKLDMNDVYSIVKNIFIVIAMDYWDRKNGKL